MEYKEVDEDMGWLLINNQSGRGISDGGCNGYYADGYHIKFRMDDGLRV